MTRGRVLGGYRTPSATPASKSAPKHNDSKFVQQHKKEVGAALIIVIVLGVASSLAFNTFGLHERIFGGVSSSRIQSRNDTPFFNPNGWVSAGRSVAKPVMSCESLAELKLPETTVTLTQSVPAGNFTPAAADPIQSLPAWQHRLGMVMPQPPPIRDTMVTMKTPVGP